MHSGKSKVERRVIEKNRRTKMKDLCLKLASIIPPNYFNPEKQFMTQQAQLKQATAYIQQLTARVEELRRRKTQAEMINSTSADATNVGTIKGPPAVGSSLDCPVLKFRVLGSLLEVVLIRGMTKNSMMHSQVISILEEEGAEVVTASLSRIGGKIMHTFHAQAKVARVGVDASKICGRLQELIS